MYYALSYERRRGGWEARTVKNVNILGMCLDRRVLIALGVAAVALWVVAPAFVVGLLPLLFLAACPLSMLLMARTMMGGNKAHGAMAAPDPAARLAVLEDAQARLAGEIVRARAEADASAAEPAALPERIPDRIRS